MYELKWKGRSSSTTEKFSENKHFGETFQLVQWLNLYHSLNTICSYFTVYSVWSLAASIVGVIDPYLADRNTLSIPRHRQSTHQNSEK